MSTRIGIFMLSCPQTWTVYGLPSPCKFHVKPSPQPQTVTMSETEIILRWVTLQSGGPTSTSLLPLQRADCEPCMVVHAWSPSTLHEEPCGWRWVKDVNVKRGTWAQHRPTLYSQLPDSKLWHRNCFQGKECSMGLYWVVLGSTWHSWSHQRSEPQLRKCFNEI